MIIKSSKAIRNGYKEISEMCKSTHEPIHLTVNGEGDLVVMDINAFYQRERQLDIREQLLAVEANRLRGVPDYPAREVIAEGRAMLRGIRDAANE
ncbi:MAG: type II toxin-antitoxin system Phd/YefM family antitoxin [Peptococcaceae bacterium]|jgi:PHD/YefM family antitoxin component YafN of YafNO toxin-antitoxin module|nr:type II toxin-antitoxin system Phd/YefM family antitoxin [Peptococcaceae bacterium]